MPVDVRRPVLCVCKDPGGTNGLVPVYKKLVEMGIDAVLIANGKAVELLSNSPDKLNFRTFGSAEDVLKEFPCPNSLVTSMCSDNGGNLGKELVAKLKKICPTIGLNDYWGASLNWPEENRPDYIVVNDKIGAECVCRAWNIKVNTVTLRIRKFGYPALDEFANFDKAKLRQEAAKELGIDEHEKVVLFVGGGTHTGNVLKATVRALGMYYHLTDSLVTLIPREHPRMRTNYIDEFPVWDEALKDYCGGRIINGDGVAKISINKLLARADLVISDFSTVLITASVLGVPNITYFDKDIEAYFKKSTSGAMEVPPVVSLGCSVMAINYEELWRLVVANFQVGLKLEEHQRRAFVVDGKNAERVAGFVQALNE